MLIFWKPETCYLNSGSLPKGDALELPSITLSKKDSKKTFQSSKQNKQKPKQQNWNFVEGRYQIANHRVTAFNDLFFFF